jgi:hypothetical protein
VIITVHHNPGLFPAVITLPQPHLSGGVQLCQAFFADDAFALTFPRVLGMAA